LPYSGPVRGVAAGSHVIDADCHHITTAELAVDREIEQGKVSNALLQVEAGSDGPDMNAFISTA
jgi:hypothetical protein